jgi:hypothetical protein
LEAIAVVLGDEMARQLIEINNVSYQQASRDLAELSDLSVAPKPVE